MWQIFHGCSASGLEHIQQYIKILHIVREELNNQSNNFWLPLEKHCELGRQEKNILTLLSGHDVLTLILNLHETFLMCNEHGNLKTWQPLWPLVVFCIINWKNPIERPPLFTTCEYAWQLCELRPGTKSQVQKLVEGSLDSIQDRPVIPIALGLKF